MLSVGWASVSPGAARSQIFTSLLAPPWPLPTTRGATRDVDALFKPHGIVHDEALAVAAEFGPPRWWLNEQASSYGEVLPLRRAPYLQHHVSWGRPASLVLAITAVSASGLAAESRTRSRLRPSPGPFLRIC